MENKLVWHSLGLYTNICLGALLPLGAESAKLMCDNKTYVQTGSEKPKYM